MLLKKTRNQGIGYLNTMRHLSIQRQIITCLTTLGIMVTAVSSFPSGAPPSACSDLMPVHKNATVQNSYAPIIIVLSETNYTSHKPINVKVFVSGPTVDPFLAFMLQGRTRDNVPVGRFSSPPEVSKFMTCYNDDDTLTHKSAYGRRSMDVVWHPPEGDVGDVYITGSIAQTKYIYWAVSSEFISGLKKYTPKDGPRRRGGLGNAAGTTSPSTTSSLAVTALSLLVFWRQFHDARHWL